MPSLDFQARCSYPKRARDRWPQGSRYPRNHTCLRRRKYLRTNRPLCLQHSGDNLVTLWWRYVTLIVRLLIDTILHHSECTKKVFPEDPKSFIHPMWCRFRSIEHRVWWSSCSKSEATKWLVGLYKPLEGRQDEADGMTGKFKWYNPSN